MFPVYAISAVPYTLLILRFGLESVRAYVCTFVFMYVTYERAGWRSGEAPYY